MDLQPTVRDVAPADRSWLASPPNSDAVLDTLAITLDGDLFAAGTFPGGLVPAGTVIGRHATTGLGGAYAHDGSDGLDSAVGHTLVDVVVQPDRVATVALVTQGRIHVDRLPANSGYHVDVPADLPMIAYVG